MSEDTEATAIADAPPTGSSRRRGLVIAGIAIAVLVIVGMAAAVVINRDDTPSYDTAQIGRMHQGCQQWTDSYQGANAPDGAWCTSMTNWMNGHLDTNASAQPGTMMGAAMWQDPTSMRTTCEQWMATNPSGLPNATTTDALCEQMVDWMNQNMGDWNGWMTDGPMMGNT